MPFVLDASVALSWHFVDESPPATQAILDRLSSDAAVVPTHWWLEVRNGLIVGELRGRSSPLKTTQFLDALRDLPITVVLPADEIAVFELARRHRLTFYDASYLELAKRERFALATLDKTLIAAASAEGVPLA